MANGATTATRRGTTATTNVASAFETAASSLAERLLTAGEMSAQ